MGVSARHLGMHVIARMENGSAILDVLIQKERTTTIDRIIYPDASIGSDVR